MKEKGDLIRVYTGTEITVNLLKEELEKVGILGIIQSDFNSGISSGFPGGIPSAIDLFIQEFDLEKAEPILTSFKKINKD